MSRSRRAKTRDIAHQSHEEQLELLKMAVEHLDVAVVVTGVDGAIRFVNPAWERMFRYEAGDVVGRKTLKILRSGEQPAEFWNDIEAELAAGRTWRGRVVSKRSDGALVTEAVTDIPVVKDGEIVAMVSVRRDVAEAEQAERALRDAALRDPLTGLPNRVLLADRIRQADVRARRRTGRYAALFIDLDDFRDVNTAVGHNGGDQVLRGVAARLQGALRPEDTLARVGGDEFVALVEGIEGPESALELGRRLSASLHAPFTVKEKTILVSASIGVTMGTLGITAEELLATADAAMFDAKAGGKDRAVNRATSTLKSALDQVTEALQSGAIQPWFQPIVHLADERLLAAEVLARWPDGPDELRHHRRFLRVAQQSGTLRDVSLAVLDRALGHADSFGGVPLHVNLSGRGLARSDMLERLPALLESHGIPPERLVVELAEDTVMRDPAVALQACRRLDELGIGVAIDDFGTGFSGLDHLQRLPVRYLKLDRRFVAQLPGSDEAVRVARALLALATALGFDVIAEGVETEEQRQTLLRLGYAFGQGWLFSAAVPAEEFQRDRCR